MIHFLFDAVEIFTLIKDRGVIISFLDLPAVKDIQDFNLVYGLFKDSRLSSQYIPELSKLRAIERVKLCNLIHDEIKLLRLG